jgi:hypothetical protein
VLVFQELLVPDERRVRQVLTLYVADGCPSCEIAVDQIGCLCAEMGIPLVIRKPTVHEVPLIPGVPALRVPKDGLPDLVIAGATDAFLRANPDLLGFNKNIGGWQHGDRDAGVHHEDPAAAR